MSLCIAFCRTSAPRPAVAMVLLGFLILLFTFLSHVINICGFVTAPSMHSVCIILLMTVVCRPLSTTLIRSYNSSSLENKAHTYPQLFISNVIVSVFLLIHNNDVVIVMIHNLLTVYRPHTYSQQHNWSDGDSHSGQEKTSVGESVGQVSELERSGREERSVGGSVRRISC